MPQLISLFILFMIESLVSPVQANVSQDVLQNRIEGIDYYYAGDSLKRHWAKLHALDMISYPTSENIGRLLAPYLETELESGALPSDFDGDYSYLARQVQESWRLLHAGQYKDAYNLADSLGLAGVQPKLRSLAIYCHYFVLSHQARLAIFSALVKEVEYIQTRYNVENTEIYLLKALAIGLYGQEMNPIVAFAKGLGGKLKYNIYKAAELSPGNVEAIMLKAIFDTEAINYAGSIASKLFYGASKRRAMDYFQQAMHMAPENSLLLLEYGKACLSICKRKELNKAYQILHKLFQIPILDLGDLKNKQTAQLLLSVKS